MIVKSDGSVSLLRTVDNKIFLYKSVQCTLYMQKMIASLYNVQDNVYRKRKKEPVVLFKIDRA